jgi:L,D-peptidoglycan transpeptidase YkuD (ErfK/YbiS/YcfS/YnhG family)
MSDLIVTAGGFLTLDGQAFRCALGHGGIRLDKREGDGATPAGAWPLRQVLYRADRGPVPATGLPLTSISPQDGWCDAPDDARYNRPVRLPYPASAEALWREDALYDLVAVIGYNDTPPVAGRGSAIFMHVAKPGYAPTEGCVALARGDLVAVLARCRPGSRIVVTVS